MPEDAEIIELPDAAAFDAWPAVILDLLTARTLERRATLQRAVARLEDGPA